VRFIQGHSTRISVYVHVQRTVTVSEGWRVGVYLCVIFIFIFIFEMGVEGREGKGREGEARGGERRRGMVGGAVLSGRGSDGQWTIDDGR